MKFKSKHFVIAASFFGLLSSNLSMATEEYQFTTGVAIGGHLQMEARFNDGYGGKDSSSFVVDELVIGIEAKLNKFAKANISLLYEEGVTDLEIDEAFLTLGHSKMSPFFLTVGQQYVPFGNFETHMVSDSLTLEIGEARETALQVNAEYGGFYGSIFAFNGSTQENPAAGTGESKIDHYGLNLGLNDNLTAFGFSFDYDVGLSYINDIGDSDGVTSALGGATAAALLPDYQYVNASAAHLLLNMGPYSFIGEYISTLGSFNVGHLSFNNQGAVLQAWTAEMGYSLNIFGKEASVALGYQGTKEALALLLPKNRYLIGLSMGIYDNTTLSFEYAHEVDYNLGETGNANTGTGNEQDRVTLQVALTF